MSDLDPRTVLFHVAGLAWGDPVLAATLIEATPPAVRQRAEEAARAPRPVPSLAAPRSPDPEPQLAEGSDERRALWSAWVAEHADDLAETTVPMPPAAETVTLWVATFEACGVIGAGPTAAAAWSAAVRWELDRLSRKGAEDPNEVPPESVRAWVETQMSEAGYHLVRLTGPDADRLRGFASFGLDGEVEGEVAVRRPVYDGTPEYIAGRPAESAREIGILLRCVRDELADPVRHRYAGEALDHLVANVLDPDRLGQLEAEVAAPLPEGVDPGNVLSLLSMPRRATLEDPVALATHDRACRAAAALFQPAEIERALGIIARVEQEQAERAAARAARQVDPADAERDEHHRQREALDAAWRAWVAEGGAEVIRTAGEIVAGEVATIGDETMFVVKHCDRVFPWDGDGPTPDEAWRAAVRDEVDTYLRDPALLDGAPPATVEHVVEAFRGFMSNCGLVRVSGTAEALARVRSGMGPEAAPETGDRSAAS